MTKGGALHPWSLGPWSLIGHWGFSIGHLTLAFNRSETRATAGTDRLGRLGRPPAARGGRHLRARAARRGVRRRGARHARRVPPAREAIEPQPDRPRLDDGF